VRFTARSDGIYQVRIHDINFRGGQAYVYRLTLRKAPDDRAAAARTNAPVAGSGTQPDFRLHLASDVLSVNRGSSGKLKIRVERLGGMRAPITLSVAGLPSGVTASPAVIAPGQTEVEIPFKAETTTRIAGFRVQILGLANVGGRSLSRTAT